jgi:hypothetical protein
VRHALVAGSRGVSSLTCLSGRRHARNGIVAVGGGFAITGTTWSSGAGLADAWLVRTDASGTPLWERTFGGEDSDTATTGLALPDGGFVVAFAVGLHDQAWLVTPPTG